MNKTNRILFSCCAVLLFVFAVSFFFGHSGAKSDGGTRTSLLNPKYKEEVSSIKIVSSEKTLSMNRQGAFWTVVSPDGKSSAPADNTIIHNLLDASSKIRMIFTVSNNADTWSQFNLSESSCSAITFFDKDGNVLSKIFFGSSSALTRRIYFRTERTISSYETDDDFSQYLVSDFSSACDPLILSYIDSPSSTCTSYSLTIYDNSKGTQKSFSIKEGEKDFKDKSYKLSQLRHGFIYDIVQTDSKRPCAEFRAESGSGRIMTIRFYEEKDNADSSGTVYRMETVCTPSPADSAETSLFLGSPHCAFTVSSWTFEGICSVFE